MGISGVTELQGCNPGRPCRVAWCVCTDDDDTAAEAGISDVSGGADSIDAQVRTVLGRVLAQRRRAAGIPDGLKRKTKPRLAEDQLERLRKAGLPACRAASDEVYGRSSELRGACQAAG